MYENRTQAAYTSPVPAPLRIASREGAPSDARPLSLGTTFDPDESFLCEDADPDESIGDVTVIPVEPKNNKWRSQPVDEVGSGVRIWNAAEERTAEGETESKLSSRAQGKRREDKRPDIVHGNNVNNQWRFPAQTCGPSYAAAQASTPVPVPTAQDPWGLNSLAKRMESLDDFFDITPQDRVDYRAELDAELAAQQARHEADFARAAAMPSYWTPDEAALAREKARRAENQAASDLIIGSLHEAMARINGEPAPAAAGAATAGAGTPRRYTADKLNPPPLMTTQEQRREKVKASVRRGGSKGSAGSKGSGGSVVAPGPGWI